MKVEKTKPMSKATTVFSGLWRNDAESDCCLGRRRIMRQRVRRDLSGRTGEMDNLLQEGEEEEEEEEKRKEKKKKKKKKKYVDS